MPAFARTGSRSRAAQARRMQVAPAPCASSHARVTHYRPLNDPTSALRRKRPCDASMSARRSSLFLFPDGAVPLIPCTRASSAHSTGAPPPVLSSLCFRRERFFSFLLVPTCLCRSSLPDNPEKILERKKESLFPSLGPVSYLFPCPLS